MASQAPPPSLFAQLKATKRLPSPPGTAVRILALCRNDEVAVQEIAETLMADPALSGRLLKFANSPLTGLNREVASIREAVMLLGIRTVKLTALGFSLASPEMGTGCRGFDLSGFWTESFLRAVIARRVAAKFAGLNREEAFTAGLLAGVGRLALAQGLKDRYTQVLLAVAEGQPLIEVERQSLGVDHVQFGAELLAEWSLPEILVEAVRSQHTVAESTEGSDPAEQLARVVNVANRLVPCFIDRQGVRPIPRQPPDDILERVLKLDEAAWEKVADDILGDYQRVAEVFNVRLDGEDLAMDLCAEAQEESTRVGMVAQLERAKALQDNRELIVRATTDQLTGVANRAKFDERLEDEIRGLRRGYGDFALILVDIDHLKKFNDTHGHQVGDLVLKRVATVIHNALRDVDLAARYGGEEFAVLAPHTGRKGACIVAARLQRCVEELRIEIDGTRLGVTISSGLAVTSDYEAAPEAEELIADADAQLYLSKKVGRNTWSYLGRSASKLRQAWNAQPSRVAGQEPAAASHTP
jgi:diguanylate cyclase (GGDEF)-like protein